MKCQHQNDRGTVLNLYLSILRFKSKWSRIGDGMGDIPIVQRAASPTSELKPSRIRVNNSDKHDVGRKHTLVIIIISTFHLNWFFKAGSESR